MKYLGVEVDDVLERWQSKLKYLVIEDDYGVSQAITLLLEGEGAEVIGPVGWAEEALALIGSAGCGRRSGPFARMVDRGSRCAANFGRDVQRQVIPIFHHALRPDGFLFLGTSENVSEFADLFMPLEKKHCIYLLEIHLALSRHADDALQAAQRRQPVTECVWGWTCARSSVRLSKPAGPSRGTVSRSKATMVACSWST